MEKLIEFSQFLEKYYIDNIVMYSILGATIFGIAFLVLVKKGVFF